MRYLAGGMTVWQIVTMDRESNPRQLREYAGELKAAGVEHLFLHGSYARGHSNPRVVGCGCYRGVRSHSPPFPPGHGCHRESPQRCSEALLIYRRSRR